MFAPMEKDMRSYVSITSQPGFPLPLFPSFLCSLSLEVYEEKPVALPKAGYINLFMFEIWY
jgi:hypothetical protein